MRVLAGSFHTSVGDLVLALARLYSQRLGSYVASLRRSRLRCLAVYRSSFDEPTLLRPADSFLQSGGDVEATLVETLKLLASNADAAADASLKPDVVFFFVTEDDEDAEELLHEEETFVLQVLFKSREAAEFFPTAMEAARSARFKVL